MVKYFYDKYSVEYPKSGDWNWKELYSRTYESSGEAPSIEVFESISFTGESFETSGRKYYLNDYLTEGVYPAKFSSHGNYARKYEISVWTNNGYDWSTGRNYFEYRFNLTVYEVSKNDVNYLKGSKGDLVQRDVLLSSYYPTNGQDGGYWYVRQSAKSPNSPTSVTLSKTSGLRTGDTITVNWSGASDPEGELTNHSLEVKRNSGSWTSVATKNTSSGSSSHSYTIPAGTTSIQFRVRVKDAQNLYSSYRESSSYTVINNVPPTISGSDRSLGDYSLPFSVDFTVNDANPNDKISVRVTLNNVKITEINNAPRNQKIMVEITKQLFDPLVVNSTNTIQIRADDGNGGVAYRTLKFKKTNSAPVISGNDTDLGIIEESPTYSYMVSDAEDDAITIVERVNDIIIRKFAAESHKDYTFTIPHEVWLQFNPENRYTILIEAIDERGAKSVRSITFKRKTTKSVITLKTPFETDVHAFRILLNPIIDIPDGGIFKAEACNNAYDEEPTWEDITKKAFEGKGYTFINEKKTADKWGVGLKITMERGSASSPIILDGFGGAYD